MISYEFYRRGSSGEDRLIGVLPERRKEPERITEESILNWVRLLVSRMSEDEFSRDVYYRRVEE